MRKNYAWLKRCSIALTLLFAASIIFYSCKKDRDFNLAKSEIEELKNWQATNFDKNTPLFGSFTPNWSTLYQHDIKEQTVFEIDLTSNEQAYISDGFIDEANSAAARSKSRIKLLIFKDKESGQITSGYYMATISEQPLHYKQTSAFTGAMYFYTNKGYFTNGWVYENGEATVRISPGNKEEYAESINARLSGSAKLQGFGREKLMIGAPVFCYTAKTPIFGLSCISVGDPPVRHCTPYIMAYNYMRYCTDLGVLTDDWGGILIEPLVPPATTPGAPPELPTLPGEEPGKNFGVDPNCQNCQIKDGDFEAFLKYAKEAGLTVLPPFTTELTTPDGSKYKGKITELRDSEGSLIAAYFTPDISSDKFTTGFSYSIGNGGANGLNDTHIFNPVFVGIGGQIIYFTSFPSLGGGSPGPNGGGTITYSLTSAQAMISRLALNAAESAFLYSQPQIASSLKTYLDVHGWTTKNKEFAQWAVKYFNDPNHDLTWEEFSLKYGLIQPVISSNGILIEDAPVLTVVGIDYPIIGYTTNRNNIEDMTYGTNHNAESIRTDILNKSNEALWLSMKDLMDLATPSGSPIAQTAYRFLEKFKTNTSPTTIMEDVTLNSMVQISPQTANFLSLFGRRLAVQLNKTNGNINAIPPIDMQNIRPVYGGWYNTLNGLTILLNDTEQTTVRLESYKKTGKLAEIVVEVTIMDHFGLDKNDAISKNHYHDGFQSWWTLQHRRGFVPFLTMVVIRKTLKITLQ